jgi:hypothetical protein
MHYRKENFDGEKTISRMQQTMLATRYYDTEVLLRNIKAFVQKRKKISLFVGGVAPEPKRFTKA